MSLYGRQLHLTLTLTLTLILKLALNIPSWEAIVLREWYTGLMHAIATMPVREIYKRVTS